LYISDSFLFTGRFSAGYRDSAALSGVQAVHHLAISADGHGVFGLCHCDGNALFGVRRAVAQINTAGRPVREAETSIKE
jgi:hypothetical protein